MWSEVEIPYRTNEQLRRCQWRHFSTANQVKAVCRAVLQSGPWPVQSESSSTSDSASTDHQYYSVITASKYWQRCQDNLSCLPVQWPGTHSLMKSVFLHNIGITISNSYTRSRPTSRIFLLYSAGWQTFSADFRLAVFFSGGFSASQIFRRIRLKFG